MFLDFRYGIDQKWHPALLTASRTLRQNILNMGLPSSTIGPSTLQHRGPPNPNSNCHVSCSANSLPTRPFLTYPHPRYSTSSPASSAEFLSSRRDDNDNDDEDLASCHPHLVPPSPPPRRPSMTMTVGMLLEEDGTNLNQRDTIV